MLSKEPNWTPEKVVEGIKYIICNPPTVEDKEGEEAFDLFREKWKEEFGKAIIDVYCKPQTPRTGDKALSPSSLGKCVRQVAFKYHGIAGRPLSPETRMTFLTGHLLELAVYMFSDMIGSPIKNIQGKVDVDGVKGSIDGTVSDWLVDVKSMSAASFDISKKNGGIDNGFGYLTQMAIYKKGMKLLKGAWIAVNKNKGNIEVFEEREPNNEWRVAVAMKNIDIVKASTPTNLPPIPYEAEEEIVRKQFTGKKKMPFNCKFCDHRESCWDILEVTKGWNNSENYYVA